MSLYKNYYVNNTAQPTGEHEVHADDCFYLHTIKSKQSLGPCVTSGDAILKARVFYDNVDGCKFCSPAYHTR